MDASEINCLDIRDYIREANHGEMKLRAVNIIPRITGRGVRKSRPMSLKSREQWQGGVSSVLTKRHRKATRRACVGFHGRKKTIQLDWKGTHLLMSMSFLSSSRSNSPALPVTEMTT